MTCRRMPIIALAALIEGMCFRYTISHHSGQQPWDSDECAGPFLWRWVCSLTTRNDHFIPQYYINIQEQTQDTIAHHHRAHSWGVARCWDSWPDALPVSCPKLHHDGRPSSWKNSLWHQERQGLPQTQCWCVCLGEEVKGNVCVPSCTFL